MSEESPGIHTTGRETHVTFHRGWLLALAALITIPWVITALIYFRGPNHTAASPSTTRGTEATAIRAVAPGAWGQLSLTPVVISPPLEYVAADWGMNDNIDRWYFPGAPQSAIEAFLLSAGLTPDEVRRVSVTARPDPRIKGLVVTPDPAIVQNLTPQIRARLYLELAKASVNRDQAESFRFRGSSVDEWLGSSLISPKTRQVIDPLIYRDGDFLLFSDPELVRSQIEDADELRRLAKVLLRQSTYLIKLTVNDHQQVDALAEYWGRGGRRTDLRPLLESVAGTADPTIDVAHLLPTFARNQLYRYPRITAADLNRPLLVNCLWTSLNFFNTRPDDRYLDGDFALKTLRNDYYIVDTGFQLGDVVAFLDSNGNLFHVATYLADGLVFSKNGTSVVAPWIITTVDELKGYYRWRSKEIRLIYHRRNDL